MRSAYNHKRPTDNRSVQIPGQDGWQVLESDLPRHDPVEMPGPQIRRQPFPKPLAVLSGAEITIDTQEADTAQDQRHNRRIQLGAAR